MSTINFLSNPQTNPTLPISGSNQPAPVARDSDGDRDGTGAGGRGGVGVAGGLFQSVLQSLSQLGLSSTSQVNGSANANSVDSNGDTGGGASGMSQNVRQAVHAFMHSLFQALGQTSAGQASAAPTANPPQDQAPAITPGSSTGSAANVQSRYADLSQKLETLAKSIETTGSGGFSDLQSSFNNLVEALGATAKPSTSASTQGSAANVARNDSSAAALQSFMKQLAQNLSNQSAPGNSGLGNPGNLLNQSA